MPTTILREETIKHKNMSIMSVHVHVHPLSPSGCVDNEILNLNHMFRLFFFSKYAHQVYLCDVELHFVTVSAR